MSPGEPSLADRLRLVAITPPSLADAEALLAAARTGLAAGIPTLQLRDKADRPRPERLRLARALADLCRSHGTLFIVNDDPALAVDAGADGVHVGPADLPVSAARAIVGPDRIVGASAGTPERARAAVADGADYLGVGAVFEARPTKNDASPPRGPEGIAAVRRAVPGIPIVAIGGVSPENTRDCLNAGADGVAAIRGLLGAADVPGAVLAFHRALALP